MYLFLGNCFQIIKTQYTWKTASQECKKLDKDAELASIHSRSEDLFVKGTWLSFFYYLPHNRAIELLPNIAAVTASNLQLNFYMQLWLWFS